MKRLITLLICVSALFAGPTIAHAGPMRDEAAVRLSLSRRFIDALQADQMATMIGQVTTTFAPPAEGLTDDERAAIQRATTAMTTEMTSRLLDAMAPIYADIFTLEELNALVAFYESDIGRSMMAKSYAAAPRITAVVMEMMPEMVRTMVDSMCKDLGCSAQERARMDAALAAAGYGDAAAPAPAPRKSH